MKKTLVNYVCCKFLSVSTSESLSRSIVSGFLLPLDPGADELADLRCAVSEAVTNCIVHAYADSAGIITMTLCSYQDRSVKITVSDKGRGIDDVAKAREPMFTTLPGEDRCGMGFSIMESFSDKLSVMSKPGKGTKVVMVRRLSSDGT